MWSGPRFTRSRASFMWSGATFMWSGASFTWCGPRSMWSAAEAMPSSIVLTWSEFVLMRSAIILMRSVIVLMRSAIVLMRSRDRLGAVRGRLDAVCRDLHRRRGEFDARWSELNAGSNELVAAQSELDRGQCELHLGKRKLHLARRRLHLARRQLHLERRRLHLERRRLHVERWRLDLGRSEGEARFGNPEMVRDDVDARSGVMHFGRSGVGAGQRRLDVRFAGFDRTGNEFACASTGLRPPLRLFPIELVWAPKERHEAPVRRAKPESGVPRHEPTGVTPFHRDVIQASDIHAPGCPRPIGFAEPSALRPSRSRIETHIKKSQQPSGRSALQGGAERRLGH